MPIFRSDPEPSDADIALREQRGAAPPTPARPARVPGILRRRGRFAKADVPAPERIGVVFVHGIGGQEPGETLLEWSAPIVRAVREWQLQHDQRLDPVQRAQIDFSGATVPVITLSVPRICLGDPTNGADCITYPAQEWLLSEAWWAKDLDPPGAREVLGWLFHQGEFTRIVTGVFAGLAENGQTGIWVKLESVLVKLFVRAVAISAPILYSLTSFLDLIPIKPLQDGLARKKLDWFLNDWFGDLRILVADRVQAANIRAKIARTVQALEASGCTRMVLIAHSGGAIASYMTLTDGTYAPAAADQPPNRLAISVDRLITHGQGLGLAWVLGHASDGGVETGDDRLAPGDHLMQRLRDRRTDLMWHDFWATHDPAPSGSIGGTEERPEPAVDTPGQSVAVVNRMSIRQDHGGYWDNDEQFVLPVLRLIETAGAPPEEAAIGSRFYPTTGPDPRGVWRRKRVRSLAEWWAWLTVPLIGVIALGIVSTWFGGRALERLGSSVTALVRAVTDLEGVLRATATPAGPLTGFRDLVIGLVGAIPGLELDVGGWLDLVGANVVAIVVLIVIGWLLGKVPGAAWNRWDDDARVASRRDAPVRIGPGGFTGRARASAAAILILLATLLWGWIADATSVPSLVQGVFVIG
ncbi:MAG: hypothetical protein AABZ33_05880 [Chloroflexota bacterium]